MNYMFSLYTNTTPFAPRLHPTHQLRDKASQRWRRPNPAGLNFTGTWLLFTLKQSIQEPVSTATKAVAFLHFSSNKLQTLF